MINLPWLNRIDSTWLQEEVRGYGHIFTLDNHYIKGGQGDAISSELARLGLGSSVRVTRFGVEAIPECGTNTEVLRAHRLDAENLVERIIASLDAS